MLKARIAPMLLVAMPMFAMAEDRAQPRFAGAWQQEIGDDVFAMYLVEIGGRICGIHLSTSNRGGKVDEGGDDGKPSVMGTAIGSRAAVTITSDVVITGTLLRHQSNLVWELKDATPGRNYVWAKATMARTHSASDSDFLKRASLMCGGR
jgi:hypothetical protein